MALRAVYFRFFPFLKFILFLFSTDSVASGQINGTHKVRMNILKWKIKLHKLMPYCAEEFNPLIRLNMTSLGEEMRTDQPESIKFDLNPFFRTNKL